MIWNIFSVDSRSKVDMNNTDSDQNLNIGVQFNFLLLNHLIISFLKFSNTINFYNQKHIKLF